MREYQNSNHLQDRESVPGITIHPLGIDRIMVDIDCLAITDTFSVRTHAGHLRKTDDGWKIHKGYCNLYGIGGTVTAKREAKAFSVIEKIVSDWAFSHASALTTAERIWRNNDALKLERAIREHEHALTILRMNLSACDNGEHYTAYPDLPTDK